VRCHIEVYALAVNVDPFVGREEKLVSLNSRPDTTFKLLEGPAAHIFSEIV
jgi:hypothetical protein